MFRDWCDLVRFQAERGKLGSSPSANRQRFFYSVRILHLSHAHDAYASRSPQLAQRLAINRPLSFHLSHRVDGRSEHDFNEEDSTDREGECIVRTPADTSLLWLLLVNRRDGFSEVLEYSIRSGRQDFTTIVSDMRVYRQQYVSRLTTRPTTGC